MTESAAPRLTATQWLICILAAIGFAFDIYELLMLPLIVGDALIELSGIRPGTPEYNYWVGILFWVPALVGGFFGLIGGYLTDRFGRRRVLVWSILLYAFSAFGAGFATSMPALLVLRCTTFIGFCVEFVAAVAWIAELFPHPKQREAVLGYTQAFSSLGGLMVTGAYYLSVTYGHSLPSIHGGHAAWRYTLISGVIPAIPLIVIRPFVPESPTWKQKKEAGTLKRPSFGELFSPKLKRTTIVTAVMVACSYGAALGALQHLPRIVPGLPEVRAAVQEVPPGPDQAREQGQLTRKTVSNVQFWQETGGLAGRLALAFLGMIIIGRRRLIRLLQIPGLIIMPLVFIFPAVNDLELLKWGVFISALLTVGQLNFWGNYLPRVYPTHLRGTGESFAANIGGRMIGTSAAFITTQLSNVMPGATPPTKLAYAAAAVAFMVYLIGLIASRWLPEPERAELPE
ncbi:MAG: MFS transporter [Acidobacteriota bacterium]